MSLADDLDAPIPLTVGDATYQLGVLDLDDLAAIDREVSEAKVRELVARLPNSHTADDVRRVQASVPGLTVEGLGRHVWTVGGAVPFLARQLVKGGSAPTLDEGRAIARRIGRTLGWREASMWAGDASGIFPSRAEQERRRAEDEARGDGKGEAPDPNVAAAAVPTTSA